MIGLLLSGLLCAEAQQRMTVDKVAAVVGNSVILYSEVEDIAQQITDYRRQNNFTLDRDAKFEALEELMQQKLLATQAQTDSLTISTEDIMLRADQIVGEMVVEAGSVKDLENRFHRPIFDIKKYFSSMLEEREYASTMRRELDGKIKITPGEVERFYKKQDKDSLPVVPIKYVYAQISKFPLSSEEAKLRVREQLLGFRKDIMEGVRFDIIARMYSEDETTAASGGELPPMAAEELEPAFASALEKLRPGQVSEVVETLYGFHLIQLIEKVGAKYRFRQILIKPKFTRDEIARTSSLLDSVANRIRIDSVTFEKAALDFSDDKYSKYNGGLSSNLEFMEANYISNASRATTKHSMETLPVADYRHLENLSPGEISDAFQTTDAKGNVMCKIVKLLEIIPSHPATLEDDYLDIESMALNQKKEDEFRKWLDKKIEGMYIRVAPEFRIPEQFQNKNWIK